MKNLGNWKYISRSCFLVCTIYCSVTLAQVRIVNVVGFAVDSAGNGVYGGEVNISYNTTCKDCIDEVFPVYMTGKDGVFFFEEKVDTNEITLNVVVPPSKDLWNPIRDSIIPLDKFPEFRGMRLIFPKNVDRLEYDLGRVHPNIFYKPVTINLGKIFGSEIEFSSRETIVKMGLNYNGKIVTNLSQVSESSLDFRNQTLTFTLPTGEWDVCLEISTKQQSRTEKLILEIL
ncbi:MAG: hypothetical protein ACK5NT_11090 [Pyrinomonadaceae bacterium]